MRPGKAQTNTLNMRGSRKKFRGGPTLFFVEEGFKILLKADNGPPAKRHLNGVRWRANEGPPLNAGLVAL